LFYSEGKGIELSEAKIYEGTFQWPTKGERIYFVIFGILTIAPLLIAAFEVAFIFFSFPFALALLFTYPLNKKLRKSLFANVYADRVEAGTTFFRTHTSRIEASKIESVTFGQSILGKSEYGNVLIGGSGGMRIRVMNLRNPEGFVEAVKSISSAPAQKNLAGAVSPLPAASSSAAKEIADLHSLLQSGVITQEEFEIGKNKALGN
jgi:hypothetical protein